MFTHSGSEVVLDNLMYKLLISELDAQEKNVYQSMQLIEEFLFEHKTHSLPALDALIEGCLALVDSIENPLEKAELLINELFVEQMLIDQAKPTWPVIAFQLSKGLDFRLLAPTLKSVVLSHIFTCCGLRADIVFVPEKTMVRIICDEQYAIIFDPVTGESIDWQQLDERMDELGGDPSQLELASLENRVLIIEHLTALKNALINEQHFDKALKCVDILIALQPEDPFERRDRGFLLHQLDCFKVAYDDYQYFVEHCPTDPAAQLLKLQLEKITIVDTVLH